MDNSAADANPYALPPEAVLRPEVLEPYQRARELALNDLVALHSTIRLLRQLVTFNWRGITGPRELFDFLTDNLGQYCVLIACRLWFPSRQGGFTLNSLRKLVREGVHPAFEGAVRQRLRDAKLNAEVTELLSHFQRARNIRLAHIGNEALDPDHSLKRITTKDLQLVAEQLGAVYNALIFGTTQHFVTIEFGLNEERGQLGYLLDLVVLNSQTIRFFEKHGPEVWLHHYGPRLHQSDVQRMNEVLSRYRKPSLPLPE